MVVGGNVLNRAGERRRRPTRPNFTNLGARRRPHLLPQERQRHVAGAAVHRSNGTRGKPAMDDAGTHNPLSSCVEDPIVSCWMWMRRSYCFRVDGFRLINRRDAGGLRPYRRVYRVGADLRGPHLSQPRRALCDCPARPREFDGQNATQAGRCWRGSSNQFLNRLTAKPQGYSCSAACPKALPSATSRCSLRPSKGSQTCRRE